MKRIVASLLALALVLFVVLIVANPPVRPSDLASCFSIAVPPDVKIVEEEIPESDHTNYWFHLSNCSASFYQQLVKHSKQDGERDEQRSQAMSELKAEGFQFPPSGSDSCEANFVSVASYS